MNNTLLTIKSLRGRDAESLILEEIRYEFYTRTKYKKLGKHFRMGIREILVNIEVLRQLRSARKLAFNL